MSRDPSGTASLLKVIDLRGAGGDLARLLPRPRAAESMPHEAVREIVDAVREKGDAAVRHYTRLFDGQELGDIRVGRKALGEALGRISPVLAESLAEAASRIESYQRHRAEVMGIGPGTAGIEDVFEEGGISVRTRRIAVERAGLYVPGGRARYPSTVLMTAIPARVAGVGQVALCIPPGPDGNPPVETLAAAAIAGVDEVYRIGGAQAIAAMAYGTESVERVDVVAGPGNVYVGLAKQLVAGTVGVPGAFAGPSEVVVIADAGTPADFAAVDLAVQAEHGPDGLAWLVTWSPEAAESISAALERIVAGSQRRDDLEATLRSGGYVALVDGPEQAARVVDAIAPEHLELLVGDASVIAPLVHNAGVVFSGLLAPASVGDYLAGPSHVLPTNGTARFAGALSVADFTKEMSVVSVAADSFAEIAISVAAIADAEGLDAHALSVRVRRGAEFR